jgi:DNA methylase
MQKKSLPELALQERPLVPLAVECMGKAFSSEDARRAHYTELLRERLRDPEFRKIPGFPQASDEDILRLSDPPYYTACPNPFFPELATTYCRQYDPSENYQREPLAVDVSEGKTDALYKAHGYHTKVPHLAIVPSILHYTRPGDVVLDGFAGSGMTGIAAQWCGTPSAEYRQKLESEWKRDGRAMPQWGARRSVLNDLSPAAAFIAANYNLPFDIAEFARAAERIFAEVDAEIGWMYDTHHTDGRSARLDYIVWSEVFACPQCAGEIVFVHEALDEESKRVRDEFPCPSCGKIVNKDTLERSFTAFVDPALGTPMKRIRLVPVFKVYQVDGVRHEERVVSFDRELLDRIERLPYPPEVPTLAFPIKAMTHGSRLEPKGFRHVHHLFLPRQAHALAALWRAALRVADPRLRNALFFLIEQAIWGMSVLNRYQPIQQGRPGGSQVNRQLSGVYYVASQIAEVSPWYNLQPRVGRLTTQAFATPYAKSGAAWVSTGDCAHLGLPGLSIDYVFTDPPFGANIPYADLNIVVEAWHRVLTDAGHEAVVDERKAKGLHEYQDMMRRCFAEYHRVLKPGRWMTVVFSNSSNAVWRAIQEAIGAAGFVIADVRTLDKQQGSYRQVTSTAVKQDLVISAYKPTERLARTLELGSGSADAVWAFVREHLAKAAQPVLVGDEVQVLGERTAQMLHDRMVAVHVQRGLTVPLDTAEFLKGLAAGFAMRDGMYFLPEQVAAYDRARARAKGVGQLDLFVQDEATAIQWVRQRLGVKPQSFADLQPQFMKELRNWPRHERALELRDLLRDNFIEYDGDGEVPPQIHDYLSTQYHDLRSLSKTNPKLVAKASGRWYVPNPAKQADIDKIRARALLREFEAYLEGGATRLKSFRTEAVRAGFKAAYDRRDWQLIVRVARRLPEQVLQEDEKLLMYYDVAATRLGDDA